MTRFFTFINWKHTVCLIQLLHKIVCLYLLCHGCLHVLPLTWQGTSTKTGKNYMLQIIKIYSLSWAVAVFDLRPSHTSGHSHGSQYWRSKTAMQFSQAFFCFKLSERKIELVNAGHGLAASVEKLAAHFYQLNDNYELSFNELSLLVN